MSQHSTIPKDEQSMVVHPLAYSVPMACEVTSLKRTTLLGLLDSGEIKSVHVGRRRLVPHAAIVEWLDRLQSQQTAVEVAR